MNKKKCSKDILKLLFLLIQYFRRTSAKTQRLFYPIKLTPYKITSRLFIDSNKTQLANLNSMSIILSLKNVNEKNPFK